MSYEESHPDPALEDVSQRIHRLLHNNEPRYVETIPPELHSFPPFVAKTEWVRLGNALKLAEQPYRYSRIPGEKWISLRCDGTGFSKFTRSLQRHGVFSPGYSQEFASIMKACCQCLITKFSARCAFTHSDELTVLIAPTTVVRGEQQPHTYNGRLQKTCSLAAATVTASFHCELVKLCINQQRDNLQSIMECLPVFDCRVGVYDTIDQALALILWRAYDCGINAVSDAVFKSGIPGAKKGMMKESTDQKLRWLKEKDLLPLPTNQRDGVFLVKRKRVYSGVNKKSGEPVVYVRGRIEQVHGNVLQLYKDGSLFPLDENLPETQSSSETKR